MSLRLFGELSPLASRNGWRTQRPVQRLRKDSIAALVVFVPSANGILTPMDTVLVIQALFTSLRLSAWYGGLVNGTPVIHGRRGSAPRNLSTVRIFLLLECIAIVMGRIAYQSQVMHGGERVV